MALTEKKLLRIKVDYEFGNLSRSEIGKKYKISQPTLRKHAELGGWEYKRNYSEVSEKLHKKTVDKLIEKEVDRATIITNRFLENCEKYNQLIMYPANELAKAIKKAGSEGKVSKEEYDRIFAGAKINKISLEALNISYNGARKALCMESDDGKTNLTVNTQPTKIEVIGVRPANDKPEN